MTPLERLRWAIAPLQHRSVSLVLGAVLVIAVSGAAATLYDLPRAIDALLALAMLAAWLVGICGMIGYFRWFFSPRAHDLKGLGSDRTEE
jgi:hypothetical protein